MRALIMVLLAALAWDCRPAPAAEIPNIAAAADLQFSLQAIATLFTSQTGKSVKLVFGSSGNFRRQIAEGAPFELFLSADENFVQALSKEGRTEGDGVLYAIGRIALFVPHGSPLKVDPQLRDLAEALADGRLKRFAIANPEHAPYGRAAQEALIKAGLWDGIRPRLAII